MYLIGVIDIDIFEEYIALVLLYREQYYLLLIFHSMILK